MYRIKFIDRKGEAFELIETDISLDTLFRRNAIRRSIRFSQRIEIDEVPGTSPWDINTARLKEPAS